MEKNPNKFAVYRPKLAVDESFRYTLWYCILIDANKFVYITNIIYLEVRTLNSVYITDCIDNVGL